MEIFSHSSLLHIFYNAKRKLRHSPLFECKKWTLTTTVLCTSSQVPSTLEITNIDVGKPNTNSWMCNGCLLVVVVFYLPQNILMENVLYNPNVGKKWHNKQVNRSNRVPLLLVTPVNAHLCSMGTY